MRAITMIKSPRIFWGALKLWFWSKVTRKNAHRDKEEVHTVKIDNTDCIIK